MNLYFILEFYFKMFYPNNILWSGSDYYIHVLKPTMELNEHTIYHIQN